MTTTPEWKQEKEKNDYNTWVKAEERKEWLQHLSESRRKKRMTTTPEWKQEKEKNDYNTWVKAGERK